MEFFYDGGCGFCERSAAWLRRLCVPELKVTPARVARQIARHAVYRGEGGWFYGHKGIGKCAQQAGAHWVTRRVGWLITAPGVSALSAAVYALVARNRHRLGCRRK